MTLSNEQNQPVLTEEQQEKNAVLEFEPLPKQELFIEKVLDSPRYKFVWYVGGFGSGKTFIGSHTALRLALRAPNGRGLIARQTLVDLKATTMKTFWEVLDRRLVKKWNKTENLLTLYNGHEIYFWGLDDIEKLKSLELGWFWIDEVNEVDEMTFNVLKGRLRNKTQPKRCGFLTSNSEGKNWTYQQFVRGKGLRSLADHAKFLTIKAPSTENIHLPEDYLEVLNSYTGDLHSRYVLASFDVFEGQIFPDLKRDVHCIKPFAIPDEWLKIGGIDHGERNPTAFNWAAVSPRGDLYFYREYSRPDAFVDEHCKNLVEMTGNEKIDYWLIDPSAKSVRGKTGKKIDQEYREEYKKLTGKDLKLRYANNDVSAGIARVHRYLRVDPQRVHPITKKEGAPRVFFFDTLTTTLDELEGYKWSKQSPTDENDAKEAPRKKDDHNVDCVRYIIMSRPDITIGTALQRFPKEDKVKDPHSQLLEVAQRNNPEDFVKL